MRYGKLSSKHMEFVDNLRAQSHRSDCRFYCWALDCQGFGQILRKNMTKKRRFDTTIVSFCCKYDLHYSVGLCCFWPLYGQLGIQTTSFIAVYRGPRVWLLVLLCKDLWQILPPVF